MKNCHWLTTNAFRKVDLFFTIIFVITIFVAYLIPQWYTFFVEHPFIYTNAWDDANYLDYQGAIGAMADPGYFSLYPISWLNLLGISGAIQNLIFCIFFPPFTLFFLYKIFSIFGLDKRRALFYAATILFASVLFNYSNHYVARYLGPPLPLKLIVPGWETYPSILRAPNPQFSYFILSFFIYLYVRYKKKIYLLMPLPFLYYFVFIPYLYILFVLFIRDFFAKKAIVAVVLANIISYLLVGIFIYVMFNYLNHGLLNDIKLATNLYVVGRKYYLPLSGCVGIIFYFLLKIFRVFSRQTTYEYMFITLIAASFAITNIQLITNFSLAIKNFQDYGNSIIGGLMLVLTIEAMSHLKNNTGNKLVIYARTSKLQNFIAISMKYFLILFIARYTLSSQGFSFRSWNFHINIDEALTQQQINHLRADPLHAIVLGSDFSQKLSYGFAHMLAPVFSYQYNYGYVFNQCSYNVLLARNALQFIHSHYATNDLIRQDIDARAKLFFNAANTYKTLSFSNQKYCQLSLYQSSNFYVVVPAQMRRVQYLPAW